MQRGAKKEEFYIDSQETVTAFHAKVVVRVVCVWFPLILSSQELMGDIDLSLLPGSVTAGLLPLLRLWAEINSYCKQGAFQPSVFDPQQTLRRAGLLNGTVFVLPSD